MPLYIEQWNARSEWLELPLDERIAYLDNMGPAMETLHEDGATLVGMALAEDEHDGQKDEQYVAIWLMPDGASQVQQFEETLESAGWHKYFAPEPVE